MNVFKYFELYLSFKLICFNTNIKRNQSKQYPLSLIDLIRECIFLLPYLQELNHSSAF